MTGKPEEPQTNPPPPPPSSSYPTKSKSDEDTKKWGTHIMGPPAVPTAHPDNQKAATWSAADHQQLFHQQHPYLQYSPVDKPSNNPFEPVIDMFNSWSKKAETVARDIWHNLKMGHSVCESAWGKFNLTAKAMAEGGFESLFKQTFPTEPNEKLKNTFACYLSTTTGPVAGTLYLSTARAAFCSDRPMSFIAPSGQEAWCYYCCGSGAHQGIHTSNNTRVLTWFGKSPTSTGSGFHYMEKWKNYKHSDSFISHSANLQQISTLARILIQHSDRSTLPCTRRCSVPRDVDQVQTMLELDPRNHFCEHIGRIICSTDLLKQNIPFIHNFSDEMETDINVLSTGMMNLVLCQTNGTLTVIVHLNVLLNNTQVFNQPM